MSVLFLLGGHDLEMQEIAALLDEREILYFDRNLRWDNASLEAYRLELEKYGRLPEVRIYGLELQGQADPVKYPNYILIDHHNDNQGREASIVQVAELLGISLSRDQLLVAANDAAYIPGMQALGATPGEIAAIRLRDRAAQGVTEEEERLAQKAIAENLEKQDGVIVIRALTSRFSPICDRLWPYHQLLIYTDDTLCYYGEGKDQLVEVFDREIRQALIYHGGGKAGFFGAIKGKWSPEELRLLKGRILSVIKKL